jgi:hypothetical protein
MAFWDKLRQVGNYPRKLRLSFGPDSYFRYKAERKYESKQADRDRQHAEESAERKGADAERDRAYEERYARERESDIGPERDDQAEEIEPER